MASVRKPGSRSAFMMKTVVVGEELDPLIIPAIDPNDPDGVIPIAYLLDALKIQIPGWSLPPSADDPLHILQVRELSDDGDRLLLEEKIGPPPVIMPAFFEREIPRSLVRRRTRKAWFYYTVTNNGGTSSCPKRQVLIDLEKPSFIHATDTVRFVVPPVPALNEAYLIANPSVAFEIPIYSVRAKGDRVEFFLANQPNAPLAPADGGELVNFSALPWTATLAADAFRKLKNGNAYVRIRIYDATGNYSELSADLGFQVAFAGAVTPGTLPAPKLINTVNKQGYLTCSSTPPVVDGVLLSIAPNTNIQVGDLIKCFWQGYETNAWAKPLANAVVEQSAEWTPQHQVSGMPVVVKSFDSALFPLRRYGSAEFRYEVWRQGVQRGSSMEGGTRVDLAYPTGGYCSPLGIIFDK